MGVCSLNEKHYKKTGYQSICQESYSAFIHAINGYYQSAEVLSKTIGKEISSFAEEMHIGYLSVQLDVPCNPLVPNGKHISSEIYRTDYDSHKIWCIPFVTAEEGTCILNTAPVRGYEWSEQEKKDIHFVMENLSVRLGRARMGYLLSKANNCDFMTSALNTRGITVYGTELEKQKKLADYDALFMNLKNFKYINRNAGHAKGDEILIKYCHTLQGFLLPGEQVARPGGDNFFALIRKERTELFLKFLQEIPITVDYANSQRTYRISANIGIYQIMPDDNIGNALDFATIALNEVKHSGKGIDQLWYAPYMMEKIMHEKQISQLFPKSLADGEFLVYYQPKVVLRTRELCGCEALARWCHQGKIIPPMEFVPVLEREGTVCNLDFYIFEKVCSDLRRWLDAGIEPVRISVNFSQQHLRNPWLADEILAIMQKYEIESRYIEIELTEMSGASNHDAMLSFLQKMRDYGICTSIDDFGTGFSSLNMLREFHMDIIKLDKSFVDKIAVTAPDCVCDRIVIENIVHMIRDLQLEIISEGVETQEQANFLRNIQCNMAQGFLFDKPLPHDEFEQRLLGNRIYHV
ncbi:MAG: EAL domain-containing protein [Ruminococcus sp.]|nr:EAL domain-containing protein [Ruminococcus sp.]